MNRFESIQDDIELVQLVYANKKCSRNDITYDDLDVGETFVGRYLYSSLIVENTEYILTHNLDNLHKDILEEECELWIESNNLTKYKNYIDYETLSKDILSEINLDIKAFDKDDVVEFIEEIKSELEEEEYQHLMGIAEKMNLVFVVERR